MAVGADRALAVAVGPRGEQPPRLERLLGQRHRQGLFEREALGDGLGPGTDAAFVVLPVPLLDQLVTERPLAGYRCWLCSFVEAPAGWEIAVPETDRQTCMDYINGNWTDMRPKSLVRAMEAEAAS
ncbi:hypothetical protein [Streptomyces prasinus]|uniref:hypothetical protein n=1 Tax=Streptomyces prasinus TaxID=67345 RepID=UPI0033CE9129